MAGLEVKDEEEISPKHVRSDKDQASVINREIKEIQMSDSNHIIVQLNEC